MCHRVCRWGMHAARNDDETAAPTRNPTAPGDVMWYDCDVLTVDVNDQHSGPGQYTHVPDSPARTSLLRGNVM